MPGRKDPELERQKNVAWTQPGGDDGSRVRQLRCKADAHALAPVADCVNDEFRAHPLPRLFSRRVDAYDAHRIGQCQRGSELTSEMLGSTEQVRLEHRNHAARGCE